MFNWREEKILITGGSGLIGSNLSSRLQSTGLDVFPVGHSKGANRFDLRDPIAAKALFDKVNPEVVFHLAAKVGGIYANVNQKSDFYLENTLINTNVIAEVRKREIPFVFAMGTGCAYPKRLENEILHEEDFLDGVPEVTNDAYAFSKRNLLVHLRACAEDYDLKYIYCIPANIYGPEDNFHPLYSHVVPGLIGRFLASKERNEPNLKIWGSGNAKRDFLFIEDLIDAIILICDKFATSGPINVATNRLTSITDLALTIKNIVSYTGEVGCDLDYPEGQKQRLFGTDKMRSLGWRPKYDLSEGIQKTVEWCLANPEKWKFSG